jgi:hypothetical protein
LNSVFVSLTAFASEYGLLVTWQDPVTLAGIGQHDRRTQLTLGQIGKRERNENYRAG